MAEQLNKKLIVKNTALLYIRMFITMLVSLYTSRIILQTLGVEDYGIYQSVAGVVGMISFLNSALSIGSSRFITFALGEGNLIKSKAVFNTTLIIHISLALLIVILAETVGLYFLYNGLNFPEDRMNIIFWVYQISVLTAVISITQVPYTATIISHERMGVYAYMSIIEVVMKLLILYVLVISPMEKLLLYAILLGLVQIIVALIYRYYCLRNFEESKFSWVWDKTIFKQVGSFSSWSLLSNLSAMLNNQGVIILLNIFFTPAIVAARAISIQVNMIINQFVDNFRVSVNPQIVKSYAQGDKKTSEKLVLSSTNISFCLILLVGLPLIINSDLILQLWLKDVPELTVVFVKLILIQSFFQVIDNSLYYGIYACGKIKQNSLISPVIGLVGFPVCYALCKMGYSAVSISWCYIVIYGLLAMVVKPILLIRLAQYRLRDIINMLVRVLFMGVVAIIIYMFSTVLLADLGQWQYFVSTCILSTIILLLAIYFFGIEKNIRKEIAGMFIAKLLKK